MNTSTEDLNVTETLIFKPFPEPQTMPAGWDLSDLVPNSSRPAGREIIYLPETQTR